MEVVNNVFDPRTPAALRRRTGVQVGLGLLHLLRKRKSARTSHTEIATNLSKELRKSRQKDKRGLVDSNQSTHDFQTSTPRFQAKPPSKGSPGVLNKVSGWLTSL